MKIILGIVVLLVLLCLIRVGVRAVFGDEGVTVDARVGPVRFRVYPRPPKKEKPPKEKTAKQKEKEARAEAARAARKARKEAEKQAKPKPERQEIAVMVRSAVRELLPPLKRSLARIGRGIRVKPLQLYVTLGAADDPAAGAQLYGEVNAAVWTVMPVVEQFVDISEPYIQINVDFDAVKTALRGETGVSIRVGTLLAAAFGIGVPAARWFLRMEKQQKQEQKENEPVPPAAAGETVQ